MTSYPLPSGLFVTGTDTGIGKTWTACALLWSIVAAGLRTGAYKPACSGAEFDAQGEPVWEDIERLSAACGGVWPKERICPQRFLAPLAPPAAAAAEGRCVDDSAVLAGAAWWDGQVDLLIVEGAGGWLAPLTENRTMADLAVELGYPVVLVAANRLGTINHTLLTLESIRQRGLPVAAVVLNDVHPTTDASAATNAGLISRFGAVTRVATLSHQSPTVFARRRPLTGVDWKALAARPFEESAAGDAW